jgi:molecular chaperone IbpA
MNAIDLTPLYRSTVGFDRLASLISSMSQAESVAASFPPYNIEQLEDNRYAVTLAVAGFDRSDLEVKVEQGALCVSGKKDEKAERKYLHQGIAQTQFERTFSLADHMEITGAELDKGLLTIHLFKQVPEAMKPRKIEIGRGEDKALQHAADKADAA